MIENPVFIVGTERSGSNLLRLILNELEELTIPHPPHLMRDLTKVIARYGDLQQEENFQRLIHDAVRLVELHFAPWPFVIDKARVREEAGAQTLYAVYAAIYEQYREHMGKARWGCKSTFMIHHVPEILAAHKAPQFIHLVRDVRDVAVSARKSVFCHYHPYYVGRLWNEEQTKAMHWENKLSPHTWFTLRYEDLIQDPETQMREVCKFLGAKYSNRLLAFFDKAGARELSGLSRSWENVGKPVLKNNHQKYRNNLTALEVKMIESVAQGPMQHYKYALETEHEGLTWKPSNLQQARYRLEEELMMLKEESLALLKDKNARFRLKKKSYLLKLRWS